jgi:hypothetical protein
MQPLEDCLRGYIAKLASRPAPLSMSECRKERWEIVKDYDINEGEDVKQTTEMID